METVPTAAEMETSPLLSHPAGLSALLSGASKRVQLCKPEVGGRPHSSDTTRGECHVYRPLAGLERALSRHRLPSPLPSRLPTTVGRRWASQACLSERAGH